MTLASLLAYTAALVVAAAIPGPGVVAIVGRALGSGVRQGLSMLSGLVVGDLVYLTAACFGLALLAERFGEVFTVIRYGASAYLAYLAWKLWRSTGALSRVEADGSREGTAGSFFAGLGVTLANPKTIFFYLALLPTLLDLSAIGVADYGILVLVTTIALYLVLVPYVLAAARARGVLRRPETLRRLNRGAAAILAGTAVWTLLRRA